MFLLQNVCCSINVFIWFRFRLVGFVLFSFSMCWFRFVGVCLVIEMNYGRRTD